MPAGIVAALAVAAFAGLAALELRRADRRHLPTRLAATAAALAGLAALAVRPARVVHRTADRAVLLTEGASAADAARVADSVGAGRIIHPGDTASVAEVVVIGWGIDSAVLPEFADRVLSFVPAPLPAGVTRAEWPARIAEGEDLEVRGSVNGVAGWVRLIGVDGSADSARAAADGGFALRVTPRVTGNARFVLGAGGVADTLAVWIAPARRLRLLVLQSAPDFETSRLRDWVSRRGGSVAIRSRVSAGRWRTERVNSDVGPLDPVTPELLRRFDLAMMDGPTLRSLSASERSALDAAVSEGGMGLLLPPGEPPFGAARSGQRPQASRIRLDAFLTPPVLLEAATLEARFGTRTLFRDERGRPVAQWRPDGVGRLATTLVRNPSRWRLEGEVAAYDRYWAELLESVARPAPRWVVDGARFAVPGEPVRISREGEQVERASLVRPDGEIDTLHLAPSADSSAWEGTYWPRLPGRHLILGPADSAGFDVRAPGGWRAARAAGRRDATLAWVALRGPAGPPAAANAERVPYPRWWFLGLFLAGAAWLWWERRAVRSPDSGKEGRTGA